VSGIDSDISVSNILLSSNAVCDGLLLLCVKVLSPAEQTELTENIASHLCAAQEFIQQRAVHNFSQADPEYGRRIQELLNKTKQQKMQVFIT